jgi:cell division protein FtsI (penicillin-binding protein 3)
MSLLPPNQERQRMGILRLITAGFVVLFVLHLLDLQVINAANINKVSLENRQKSRTIEAVRGSIFDKDGNVLARSIYRYDVNVAPVNVGPISREVNGATITLSVDQIAEQLAAILEMDKDEILRRSSGTGQYANLKKKVDASVYSQINSLNIPWVYFDSHLSRIYPNGAVAGNLIGFITSDGATKAGLLGRRRWERNL